MQTLVGRAAVVTGSGRSLGAGIAVALAESGANLVVNSRSSLDEAEEIAAECRSFGVEAICVVADVATEVGVSELAEQAYARFGRIDILVNNVGVSPTVPFLEITFEDWHTAMSVNADSMFLTCQAFAPSMIEAGWGRIVNITGHAYLTIGRGSVHTKASKAAAVGLTRGLAGALAKHNITVNHIAPGLMDTEPRRNKYYRDDKPLGLPPWGSMERTREVPLGRTGTVREFSSLVRYLCTEDAGYLTGQSYLVNGGQMAL